MPRKNLDAIRAPKRNRISAPVRDISELPISKDVLTLSEVALILHTASPTIRRLIKTAALPCRKVGNSYLFSAPAVLQWLDSPENVYLDSIENASEVE